MKCWWAGLILFNTIMGIAFLQIGVYILILGFGFMSSKGNPFLAVLLGAAYLGILIFVNRWIISKLPEKVKITGFLLRGLCLS